MKSLIVLVALVALASADANWETCMREVHEFKKCMINGTVHEAFKEIMVVIQAVNKTCIVDKNSACRLRHPPTAQQHMAAPPSFPSPPAEVAACFHGAEQAFVTCFKAEAGITEDLKKPEGLDHTHRPPMGGHHFTKEEMDKIALEACNNDAAAAKELEDCAIDVFRHHHPINPIALGCQVGPVCARSHPISPGCGPLLEKGFRALCKCRQEFPRFINTSSTCEAAKKNIHDHMLERAGNETAKGFSAAHHGIFDPHDDHHFDICSVDIRNLCNPHGSSPPPHGSYPPHHGWTTPASSG